MNYTYVSATTINDRYNEERLELLEFTIRMIESLSALLPARQLPPITAGRIGNIVISLANNNYYHWIHYPDEFSKAVADFLAGCGDERAYTLRKHLELMRGDPGFSNLPRERAADSGWILPFFEVHTFAGETLLTVIIYHSQELSKEAA